MTAGTAKRLLATKRAVMISAAALILQPAAGWCAGPDIEALLTRLARPAPASTPFIEARFSTLLAKPLIVSGDLEYLGPGALARSVREPFKERTEIHDETVTVQRENERSRRFSLQRAPELRALLDSFSALLSGDRTALEKQFTLDPQGDEQAWKLVLTPKESRVKQRIREITVTGIHAEPRCLVTMQPDGNASILLLAGAASVTLPQAPERTWFEDYCRGTRN